MSFCIFDKKDKQIERFIERFIESEKSLKGDILVVSIIGILIIFSFFAPNLFFLFFYLFSAIAIGLLHIRNTKKKT